MNFNKKPIIKTNGKAERVAMVSNLYDAGLIYSSFSKEEAILEVSRDVYEKLKCNYCFYSRTGSFGFHHKASQDHIMTNSVSHFIMSCRKRCNAGR